MPSSELFFDFRKLGEKQFSCYALKDAYPFRDGYSWWGGNKDVHMVAVMNSGSQQLVAMLLCNLFKQISKPNLNFVHEYLAPVFGGIDKVVVGGVDACSRVFQVAHCRIGS